MVMFSGRIHSCSLSFVISSLSCQRILVLHMYNAPPISLEIGRTFTQCFSRHYTSTKYTPEVGFTSRMTMPTLTGGHRTKHTGVNISRDIFYFMRQLVLGKEKYIIIPLFRRDMHTGTKSITKR